MMMRIKDILKGIEYKACGDLSGLRINKVKADSRLVGKGDLFIALRGYEEDGRSFIGEAVAKGAAAVVAEKDFNVSGKTFVKILAGDTRKAMPVIAANFHRHPAKRLKITGITGTNGKTTATYLIESILKRSGKETGVIGTINYRFKNKAMPAKNTTPGPLELQAIFADMVKEGVSHVAMEVSSHSLDQGRLEGVLFDEAVFTNITPEHLDYHKTMKNYFSAKARIFAKLKKNGAAILNNDDRNVRGLAGAIKNDILTYGIGKGSDIAAKDIDISLDGSVFTVVTPKGTLDINTRLIGKHNVSNILAAIAVSFAKRIPFDSIREGIKNFDYTPGRLEAVREGQPFRVFVDYAHTTDALYNVLGLLKGIQKDNRIITVFGCGGNRDKKKRPLMGEAACRFSDKVIITSDNPRLEEPFQIIRDIEKGVKNGFDNYEIIEDRRAAIKAALKEASPGDIVLIAGKGHEKCQIVKDKIIPFNDCEIAREIISGIRDRDSGIGDRGAAK